MSRDEVIGVIVELLIRESSHGTPREIAMLILDRLDEIGYQPDKPPTGMTGFQWLSEQMLKRGSGRYLVLTQSGPMTRRVLTEAVEFDWPATVKSVVNSSTLTMILTGNIEVRFVPIHYPSYALQGLRLKACLALAHPPGDLFEQAQLALAFDDGPYWEPAVA